MTNIPDPPEGKVQPDGRVVIGPDLSKEKGQSGFAPGLFIAIVFCLAFAAAGFLGGRATAPAPDPVQQIALYSMERIGGTGCSGFNVVVSALSRSLTSTDITIFENNLKAMGYQYADVRSTEVNGHHFAVMSAGFGCKEGG